MCHNGAYGASMGEDNLRICIAASLNCLAPFCNAADLCVKTFALRRHKRRLKNHRTTLTTDEENEVDAAPMLVYASADQLIGDDGDDLDTLPVVADLSYDIEVLTVEQAVMRLELSGTNMLMFRNASHFGLNVVHLRDDGSIGWIDPRGARRLATSV